MNLRVQDPSKMPIAATKWMDNFNSQAPTYYTQLSLKFTARKSHLRKDRTKTLSPLYMNLVIQLYSLAGKQYLEDYRRTRYAVKLDENTPIPFKTSNPGFAKLAHCHEKTAYNFFKRIEQAGIIMKRDFHGRHDPFVLYLNPQLTTFTTWVGGELILCLVEPSLQKSLFSAPILHDLSLSNTTNNLLSKKAVSTGGKPVDVLKIITKQASEQPKGVPEMQEADEQETAVFSGSVAGRDKTLEGRPAPAPEFMQLYQLAIMLWTYSKTKIFNRLPHISRSQEQHSIDFLFRVLHTFGGAGYVNQVKKRLELSAELFNGNFDSGRWTETPLPTTYFNLQNEAANGFLYSKTLYKNFKISLQEKDDHVIELQIAVACENIFKKALQKSFGGGKLRADIGETYLEKNAPELLPDFHALVSPNVNALQNHAQKLHTALPSGMSYISQVMQQYMQELRTGTHQAPTPGKWQIKVHPKYLKK